MSAQQPSDFNFTPTNNFASLYGQVQLNSEIINSNSWIAAFDENGICSGATPVISYDGISFFNLRIAILDTNESTFFEKNCKISINNDIKFDKEIITIDISTYQSCMFI